VLKEWFDKRQEIKAKKEKKKGREKERKKINVQRKMGSIES